MEVCGCKLGSTALFRNFSVWQSSRRSVSEDFNLYLIYTVFITSLLHNVFVINYCSDIVAVFKDQSSLSTYISDDGQELWPKHVGSIISNK